MKKKPTATLTVQLNRELKEDADELFEALGMDTETAVRVFLIQCLRSGRIPFEIGHEKSNGISPEALLAMMAMSRRDDFDFDDDDDLDDFLMDDANERLFQ